jgi:hypothetical protein
MFLYHITEIAARMFLLKDSINYSTRRSAGYQALSEMAAGLIVADLAQGCGHGNSLVRLRADMFWHE